MPRRSAETAFGEVEYDTVTCTSCENEVAKTDAKRFVVGDVVEYRDWSSLGKIEYNFDPDTLRKGWACPYCASDPVKYPVNKMTAGQLAASAVSIGFGLLVVGWVMGMFLLQVMP